MQKLSSLILASAVLVSLTSSPVFADNDRWHGDIHRFHEHDYDHWRGGNWFNGFHDGRNGWWWVVDGIWYYYPAPIYPYPDPYTPPVVIATPAPVAPAPPSYVYYCRNPAGYYPYVPLCTVHWRKVAPPSASTVVVTSPAPVRSTVMVPTQSAPPKAVAVGSHEADERQLGALSVEFDNISAKDEHALNQLDNLESRVEEFRQSLFKRSYNAMALLKKSEELKNHIAEKKQQISK